jgi:hypothetical protein
MSMLISYFNGCVTHVAFALWLKNIYLKNLIGIHMSIQWYLCRFPSVVFQKYKIIFLKQKEIEDDLNLLLLEFIL